MESELKEPAFTTAYTLLHAITATLVLAVEVTVREEDAAQCNNITEKIRDMTDAWMKNEGKKAVGSLYRNGWLIYVASKYTEQTTNYHYHWRIYKAIVIINSE